VEAAAADAADLAGRIARGEARLFTAAVYVTVHAAALADLDAACQQVRAAADATLLDLRPGTFRQLPGVTSTLPFGVDAVGATRSLDTDTVAAAFPFASPDAPEAPHGVLYGLNTATGAPVMWDRWAQDNHNSIVLARSGAGKSYFTKTEILRHLYDGVQVAVIDPDGEYHHLAAHVDGVVCSPGAAGVHLNPLALPADPGPDALTRRVMFIHTLAATMLGADLAPDEAAALDEAVLVAYNAAGIGTDPATWHHAPPVLPHVLNALSRSSEPGPTVATRLAPYVTGGLSGLFDGDPTPLPSGHFTVYDLSQLPDELTAAGTLLVLDAIQSGLTADGTRRLVVVDEAWRL
ncbi:MAG: VirB4 family type IV secretion system protein, partial [Stackebrandtia sp.]